MSHSSTIPRQVHAIWWQGWAAMPPRLQTHLAQWQATLPDWDMVFWDAQRLAGLIEAMPPPQRRLWQTGWQLARHDIQRIDLCKWAILWAHGGLYSDLDIFFFRDPATLLAGHTFYICCETLDPPVPCNALMASVPQMPLLEAVVQAQVATLQRPAATDRFTDVMNTTGPKRLACIFDRLQPLPSGVCIDRQVEHIYPVPWQQRPMDNAICLAAVATRYPQAYAFHVWAGLWK